MFLVVKIISVRVIREDSNSDWDSPYLDAHDEEGENLNRGKRAFSELETIICLECL